jgi:hypothetical protein
MMIYSNHPQGTPEWLEARRGVITASRFRDAREKLKGGAPSKAAIQYAMDTARERLGGRAPQKFVNAAMREGTEQEPLARIAYEARTGRLVEEIGFAMTDDRLFGVSVDGLVGDDGIVEIKTMVSSDTLFTALGGDVSAYMDQCLGAMWLLHRQWVDLVLWAPDLKGIGRHLTVRRIDRDENAIEALADDLVAFNRMVEQYVQSLKPSQSLNTPAIAAEVGVTI